jgi:hypothetical protein
LKFNFVTSATFPPTPTIGLSGNYIGSPTWKLASEDSGQTSILIEGPATIQLNGLLISWSMITTAGYLQITYDPDVDPIKLYQSEGSGHLYIPMNNVIGIGATGLQVANNSVGGEYSVLAFYEEL